MKAKHTAESHFIPESNLTEIEKDVKKLKNTGLRGVDGNPAELIRTPGETSKTLKMLLVWFSSYLSIFINRQFVDKYELKSGPHYNTRGVYRSPSNERREFVLNASVSEMGSWKLTSPRLFPSCKGHPHPPLHYKIVDVKFALKGWTGCVI